MDETTQKNKTHFTAHRGFVATAGFGMVSLYCYGRPTAWHRSVSAGILGCLPYAFEEKRGNPILQR